SSLHLSGLTLANGNASTGNASYGGAIYTTESTVSFTGNMSFISNQALFRGGAICALDSTVFWDGDGTQFIDNHVGGIGESGGGGAISAEDSTVSWVGNGAKFISNSASGVVGYGGAIYAIYSTVSWGGDGTQFINNSALVYEGGAIFALESDLRWDGDGTDFVNNYAGLHGGAISLWDSSNVSWTGDGTRFISNSADAYGGVIRAYDSIVSWYGDGTRFMSNIALNSDGGAIHLEVDSELSWVGDETEFIDNASASDGGSIFAWESSTVSWVGNGTRFIDNFGSGNGGAIHAEDSSVSWTGGGTEFSSNSAALDGGAIYVISSSSTMPWENTTFSSNVAGQNGGAVAVSDFDDFYGYMAFVDTTFVDNRAGSAGGAIFSFNVVGSTVDFTDVTFQSNSAGGAGGAVAAYETGDSIGGIAATFSRCTFSDNVANETGGATDTLTGYQEFDSCEFEGNSAPIGGAMRLGGTTDVLGCSFLSNSASVRGSAIAVVASTNISGCSFDKNEIDCAADTYRHDYEEDENARFDTVCADCGTWGECSGCTIEEGDVVPVCETPLEHTTADEPGLTLETLSIDGGYWRVLNNSDNIFACYNPDACRGGQTGAGSFCASGYEGPYCAVCEAGYSPSLGHSCTRCSSSRRQGLVAAAVIAALVAVFAVVTIFKFLLSTDVGEEGNIGSFRRRVLRAVPVQALKIIVVVWQILTQFADAANVTYPGVYQAFLGAIDVINFDLGSVLAAGCLWSGIDFHGRLLVSTIGPLVVVGFLATTYLIAVGRNGASGDATVAEKIRHKHQKALLLFTFLVYSSVSSIVFQTFACETLDDDIEYLRADYRIHCTDPKHKAFEVYAGFMLFVYPVGIPLLYAALLFQRRDVLAHADADKTVAQPIAGLWEAYRPERFYYEVIECGRRILLTGVVVFIFPNTAAQIATTMLIAFFFFAVFEVLSPYKSESDMWLSRGGHVIVFLSMFDLLLLKVDVSGERDQSQAAFAGVLVAGHVLMVLAIVVEVVGVCYASRKKKVVEGEEASERPRQGSDDVPEFGSAPA
ncbi:unnamed protein product, partial [Scytosiphon promiscuus]